MARTPHMHETSVAQRMVDAAIEVADQNGGGQVVGMRLLLGEMTCVDAETLSFAFGVVSRGTRVEKCQLEIVRVPTRLRCRTCGLERGGDLLEPCVCGMPGGEVLAGRELRLDTIDIDEEAALAAGKQP
jgi:hydrogenase nickel incorporation protein HypA/HybF